MASLTKVVVLVSILLTSSFALPGPIRDPEIPAPTALCPSNIIANVYEPFFSPVPLSKLISWKYSSMTCQPAAT
jgi:hypothetical protein